MNDLKDVGIEIDFNEIKQHLKEQCQFYVFITGIEDCRIARITPNGLMVKLFRNGELKDVDISEMDFKVLSIVE
jgi:hypothetical protein